MIEILTRILEITERIYTAEELPTVVLGIFGVLLVFGVLNCILGYRLLRFWVMLFGFAAGALAGLFLIRSMGTEDKLICLAAMIGLGAALGIVSFLIYKLGIFILGAGIGMTLSIYILHPTTSFVFFTCILVGVGVGTLGVRFAREVIIVGTSLLGGLLAGFSLSRLGRLPEFPYGIGLSAGFAVLGLLIQFATNRKEDEEEEDAEVPENQKKAQNNYDDIGPGEDEDFDIELDDIDVLENEPKASPKTKRRTASAKGRRRQED